MKNLACFLAVLTIFGCNTTEPKPTVSVTFQVPKGIEGIELDTVPALAKLDSAQLALCGFTNPDSVEIGALVYELPSDTDTVFSWSWVVYASKKSTLTITCP